MAIGILLVSIGCFGYVYYIHRYSTLAEERNEEYINNAILQMDSRLSSVDRIGKQIAALAQRTDLLYARSIEGDVSFYYEAKNFLYLLNLYSDMTPMIGNSYVYFSEPGILMTDDGMISSSYSHIFPSDFSSIYEDEKDKGYVVFSRSPETGMCYYYAPLSSSSYNPGCVILILDPESLSSMVDSILAIKGTELYVKHSSSDGFLISEGVILPREYAGPIGLGKSTIRTDRKSYTALRTCSSDRNWEYTVLIDKALFTSSIYTISAIAIALIVSQLAASVILAYSFSKRTYSPIARLREELGSILDESGSEYGHGEDIALIENQTRRLFSEYHEAIRRLDQSEGIIAASVTRRLLNGLDDDALRKEADRLGLFSKDAFLCIALMIRESGSGEEDSRRQAGRMLLMDILGNRLRDINAAPAIVDFDYDTVIVVLNDDEINADSVAAFMADLQSFLHASFSMVADIGISSVKNGMDSLFLCCNEALRALDSSYAYSDTGVYVFDSNQDRDTMLEYPIDIEDQIMNAAKVSNYGRIEHMIDSVLEINASKLREKDPRFLRFFVINMTNTIIRCMQEISIPDSLVCSDRLMSIIESRNFNDAIQEIKGIYGDICSYNEKKKKSHNDRLIEDVLEHIRANYSDSSLSLVSIADRFGINPTYLSVFFKEQVGDTYINYLTSLRLERSLELLESTDRSISAIANDVGYLSSGVFIRVFKKRYSISPGAYRTAMKGKRDEEKTT
ncbi:MAG: helix-turn-helix domain-containing protein [Candidatus Ornithospirochaeta sp.]|nr:helix-turn-helix domain-containing protein [Candidatus Ornithospirochaeta sp.]